MALDLFSLPKESRDVLEREYFNPYVDKRGPDECWLWMAYKRSNGYGQFHKRLGKGKYAWGAHRAAWIFKYNAPIPAGLDCCHTCDVRACVNPSHIFIATRKYNMRDSINKGRFTGWASACAKRRANKKKLI
jgi:hypothetical protein